MPLRLATVVFVAAAVASSSAFACKGPTTIFQDNFQTPNPAWHGNLDVSGGRANVTASPLLYAGSIYSSTFGGAFYGGKFIDSGDACVDMVGPKAADPTTVAAGIIFGFTDLYNYYAFLAREDGQAAVIQFLPGPQRELSLIPVSFHPASAMKIGGDVTNTLRVTWSGTSASTYINDQPFFSFSIQAFQNTMVGFFVQPEFGPGLTVPVTYQFSNLKVTNVP